MTTTRRDALKTVLGSVALSAVGSDGATAEAGAKFVYANNSPYDNLDPHTIFDTARAATRFNLYDGLYRWVDNPPKMIASPKAIPSPRTARHIPSGSARARNSTTANRSPPRTWSIRSSGSSR